MKHVPKHRAAPARPAVVETPRKALRSTLVFSSVAVAATGISVSAGLLSSPPVGVAAATDIAQTGLSGGGGQALRPASTDQRDRVSLSRSADRRDETDPIKSVTLSESEGPAVTGSKDLSDADPRDIGRALLGEFGFGQDQFGCLDSLYMRESQWNVYADNPSSSAYGIPQALPGSKMASAGPDWTNDPVTQIRWGLGYIQDRYGSPCGAWGHSESHGWY